MSKGESLEELQKQAREIAQQRGVPCDRMDAAIRGFSEEEWQKLVAISEKAKKLGFV